MFWWENDFSTYPLLYKEFQGMLSAILGTSEHVFVALQPRVRPHTVWGAGEPDWRSSGSGHPGVRGQG